MVLVVSYSTPVSPIVTVTAQGVATLTSGAVVISTNKVTSSSLVILTGRSGAVTNLGMVTEDNASRIVGTSFKVKSSNILDSSTFVWMLAEPA